MRTTYEISTHGNSREELEADYMQRAEAFFGHERFQINTVEVKEVSEPGFLTSLFPNMPRYTATITMIEVAESVWESRKRREQRQKERAVRPPRHFQDDDDDDLEDEDG